MKDALTESQGTPPPDQGELTTIAGSPFFPVGTPLDLPQSEKRFPLRWALPIILLMALALWAGIWAIGWASMLLWATVLPPS